METALTSTTHNVHYQFGLHKNDFLFTTVVVNSSLTSPGPLHGGGAWDQGYSQ